jgi:oligosaccharide translocation protein RFT1
LPPMASALSATLLSSARSLVLLQLGSRILTFILNQALLTYASSEVFGTAAVQFDLLGSTLLFLSREGIRGALLREPGGTRQTDQGTGVEQDALNLSLVPLPIFLTLAGVLVPCYVLTSPSATIGQPFFFSSLALHLLAYLFELLSEPYYIQLQRQLRLNIRVQAEGAAVIVRAIVTLVVVRRLGASHALLAFGIGQACYGTCLLARFAHAFGWKALSMWMPRRLDQASVQVSQG